MESLWPVVGTLGMWCIEASYFPQLARLYRRKEAEDISLLFPGLNLIGRVLACLYALHAQVDVLAFGFMLGIGLRGALLFQVIYYRHLYQEVQARQSAPVPVPQDESSEHSQSFVIVQESPDARIA